MKTIFTFLFAGIAMGSLALGALTACGSNQPAAEADTATAAATITGEWTKPIVGQADSREGFKLNEDGTAASINMATLQYSTWKRKGDTLLLSGKSIGNGQTIDFTDMLTITELAADSMTLTRGSLSITYHK